MTRITSPTADDVNNLCAGDRVRMPCEPSRWQTVAEVKRSPFETKIVCTSGIGHCSELPLEIEKH